MRKIIILLIFTCLISCSFHPRGTIALSPSLQQLYLKTNNPYGQLAQNLRNYFTMSGIELTSSPNNANLILDIIKENESQQLLSVSGTQQTRQYNLIYTVVFQVITPKGALVIPPQTLSETRAFTTISDQILGGTNEATMLYQQMRRAIVYDMMNRLSSQEMTALIENKTT
jgi:LPS-assembly lipoprotein